MVLVVHVLENKLLKTIEKEMADRTFKFKSSKNKTFRCRQNYSKVA